MGLLHDRMRKRINHRQWFHRLIHRKCWNCNVPLRRLNTAYVSVCDMCGQEYPEIVMHAHERNIRRNSWWRSPWADPIVTRSALRATSQDWELFSALDLPPELHPLQNAYWEAEREWKALRNAYGQVLADMLKRLEPCGD